MKKLAVVIALLAIAGCENVDKDLWYQASYKTQEFPRKINPVGSVPVTGKVQSYIGVDGVTLTPPFALDEKAAANGKKRYDIFCLVCHGSSGHADTPVAQKMEVMPFDITEEGTRSLSDGEIFVKIVASQSIMPRYRNELSDAEAWEVTAYVRQLQK